MAFPAVEIGSLSGGICPKTVTLSGVPVEEMEVLGGRLVEKGVRTGCRKCFGRSTTRLKTKRFLKTVVHEYLRDPKLEEIVAAPYGTGYVDLNAKDPPLTNRQVIQLNARCMLVRERYTPVSDYLKRIRDWYVSQNMVKETPTQMPRMLLGLRTSSLTVIHGNGFVDAFNRDKLTSYLENLSLDKPLEGAEIQTLIDRVIERAQLNVGRRISSRQLVFYVAEQLRTAGISILKPEGVDRLSEEDLKVIGIRGHIYQVGAELFWKLYDLIYN